MGDTEKLLRRAKHSQLEDDEYELVRDQCAPCLLCIALPMYPVALILYTFAGTTNLWLIFLWIAVMSTVAAFLFSCVCVTLRR
jgi:hypothetical protein